MNLPFQRNWELRAYLGRCSLMMALDEQRYSESERADARRDAYKLNPPSNSARTTANAKWHPPRPRMSGGVEY